MYSERLAAARDGARFIKYDPNGFVLAWYGGHGLHIYRCDGVEVDFRTVGDMAHHEATEAEIKSAAISWISEDATDEADG